MPQDKRIKKNKISGNLIVIKGLIYFVLSTIRIKEMLIQTRKPS